MTYHPCEICGNSSFKKLFSKEGNAFFQCTSCHLIRIDPQPTDAVLMSIYGSEYYKKAWGTQSGADRVYELKKGTFHKHVFSRVQLPSSARVLDCGAAFGALMDAAIEIAQRFGPDRVFVGPFEEATFPGLNPVDFDAVFMCDFIEHVRDPVSALKKAIRFLKSGGQLAMTTPDGGSLSCQLMKAAWPHYKIEHLHYFNRENMGLLLERLGMTTILAQAAHKVLDLEYIRHQFTTYPRFAITPLINLLARVVGPRLATRPQSFSFGEMIIVAVKK
jgi:SAM-dependent methyltransferase